MILLPLALAAVPAVAAGPLPIARGDYVQADTPCADPPFAAMRRYDGRGLATPHSRDCRARVVARHGRRLTIANDCIDAGAGPAPRSVERLEVTRLSRTRFTLGGTRFRLCPAAGVPGGRQTGTVSGG